MNSPNLTTVDIDAAARHLARSERGRAVGEAVLKLLEDAGGLGLDGEGKQAVMTLLYAAFTDWPGYAREAIEQAQGRGAMV